MQRCRTVKLQSEDCKGLFASNYDAHGGRFVDSDIKGALHAGLSAILYSPTAQESRRLLFGEEVPVFRHMGQLLEHLGVMNPNSSPVSSPGQASRSSRGSASTQ